MVAVQNAGGAIDLPADMQRELRDLEARGDRLTHYELLGITAAADAAAIRRAYLVKSKRSCGPGYCLEVVNRGSARHVHYEPTAKPN